MATAYGSWAATDDYRAKMTYSTSTTATQVTITVTLYIESDVGWSSGNDGNGKITIKKGSTTLASASGSGQSFGTKSTVQVCSKSHAVTRTTSSQTISLSGSVGAYAGTSTASATVTVPALATYTVSYNANGGSGAPSSQTKTYGKTLTLSSTKPKRTGYTFSKWNTKSGGTGTSYAAGASYTANAAATLYAIWTANKYTVSYNANGGSGAPSSQTKTYDKSLTLSSTKPTRTGYTFSKWNTKSDGSGTGYAAGATFSTNITSDTTLYAIWTANKYTVSYNANGGSGAPSSQTKTYNAALTLSSTKPTRTGYTFSKWDTKSDGSGTGYSAGATLAANTITANLTLYAIWTANKYTVSYNANGGSGAPSSQTKTYDKSLTLSSTKPTRTGYTFLGWATSSTATSATYAAGASYTANKAATLYAVWKANGPKVTISKAYRCDSSGEADDEGTYLRVKGSWRQDAAGTYKSTITVTNASTKSTVATLVTDTVSGTSGTIDSVVDAGLSTDLTYVVAVKGTNANGSTTAQTTLGTSAYPIDIYAGGGGIAFGRAARRNGWIDVGWPVARISSSNDITQDVDATTNGTLAAYVDVNNEMMAQIRGGQFTNSRNGIVMVGRNRSRDGENTVRQNALALYVTPDGTPTVSVTTAARPSWRTALGASSGGIWPISLGGTGQSEVTSVTTVASVITAGSGITISSVAYRQWGKLVQLAVAFTRSSAISIPASGNIDNVTVGTIVSGKRPPQATNLTDASGSYAFLATVSTAGAVQLTMAEGTGTARTCAANTTITLRGTYMLA